MFRTGPGRVGCFTTRLQLENRPVIASWNDLSVKGQANRPRILALCASVVAGLCVAAPPAVADPGHGRQATTPTTVSSPGSALAVQGVVQSVSASAVLVKQLDGSAVIVPVDRRTQVFVNGKTGGVGRRETGVRADRVLAGGQDGDRAAFPEAVVDSPGGRERPTG